MRVMALAVVSGGLVASTPAWADDLELTGGVGAGSYVFHVRYTDPELIVPFREVGAQAVLRRGGGLSYGLQVSAREDATPTPVDPLAVGSVSIGGAPGQGGGGGDPSVAEEVRAGTRWRVAPFVGWQWREVRTRVGLVAGSYYNPTAGDVDRVWIYPQASVGLGNDLYHIEVGLLDAPALASAATGGMGVLALRIGLLMMPGHRALIGTGAPYQGPGAPDGTLGGMAANGYLSYAYQAEFSGGLSFQLGGFTSTDTTGLFVAIGHTLR